MNFELEDVGPSFGLPLFFSVAGTGFEGRASVIRRYCAKGAEVRLEREPDNSFDPMAIAVFMTWYTQAKRPIDEHIGYVPRALAEELTELMHTRRLKIERAAVHNVIATEAMESPRVTVKIEGTLAADSVQIKLPIEEKKN